MPDTRASSTAAKAAPPTVLFQGVNSVLGQGLSTAVEGEWARSGGSSETRCNVSVDIQELADSLSIDQSLSVGLGPLGSINQKTSFVHSLKVRTTSVVLSVYSRRTLDSQAITNVRFKPGLVFGQDIDAFVRAYGDSYASSLTRGGEYIGVYVFYSQTREEQKSLAISLGANGVFDAVKVGTDLQTKIDSFLKTTKVNYSFQQWSSGLSNFISPEPAGFIDFALRFPSLSLDSPVVIGFTTAGYETVPGAGDSFTKAAANRTYFGGNAAISGLTEKLVNLTQISNQINWINGVHKQYNYRGDTQLKEARSIVASDIDAVNKQMNGYLTKATDDFEPLNLRSLDFGSPVLGRPDVRETPAWGGSGGGPFDDVDLGTYIQRKMRIAEIGLRGGNRVDRLTVTYTDAADQRTTVSHGGDGGSDKGSLKLIEGETIVKVAGRSGLRLDQVTFTSSQERSLTAGVDSGGSPFGAWEVPQGSFVMGFKGRSGKEIDALQVIYASLTPARWPDREE